MSNGTYTWTVKGDLLQQMKAAKKSDEQWLSPIFQIGGLDWQIQAFPNDSGSFGIYVKLLSLPEAWKTVLICREIYCPETGAKDASCNHYQKDHTHGWPNWTMTLDKISKCDRLSFVITLSILQYTVKKKDKIYYKQKVSCPVSNTFEWKLDKALLKKMKKATQGNQFCSPIFYKMWCISIKPNGKAMAGAESGWCSISLKLCGLPRNVKQMRINWNIEVALSGKAGFMNVWHDERNDFDFTEIDQSNKFKNAAFDWGEKKLSFKDFKKCKAFNISVRTLVLHEIDHKDNKYCPLTGYKEPSIGTKLERFIDEQRLPIKPHQAIKDRDTRYDSEYLIKTWFFEFLRLPQHIAEAFLGEGFEDLEEFGQVTIHNLYQMGITAPRYVRKIMQYKDIYHVHQRGLKQSRGEEKDKYKLYKPYIEEVYARISAANKPDDDEKHEVDQERKKIMDKLMKKSSEIIKRWFLFQYIEKCIWLQDRFGNFKDHKITKIEDIDIYTIRDEVEIRQILHQSKVLRHLQLLKQGFGVKYLSLISTLIDQHGEITVDLLNELKITRIGHQYKIIKYARALQPRSGR